MNISKPIVLFLLELIKCSPFNRTNTNETQSLLVEDMTNGYSYQSYRNETDFILANNATTNETLLIKPMEKSFGMWKGVLFALLIIFIGYILMIATEKLIRNIKKVENKKILISSTASAAFGIIIYMFFYQLWPLFYASTVGHKLVSIVIFALLIVAITISTLLDYNKDLGELLTSCNTFPIQRFNDFSIILFLIGTFLISLQVGLAFCYSKVVTLYLIFIMYVCIVFYLLVEGLKDLSSSIDKVAFLSLIHYIGMGLAMILLEFQCFYCRFHHL